MSEKMQILLYLRPQLIPLVEILQLGLHDLVA
jgi:hypothetical protein